VVKNIDEWSLTLMKFMPEKRIALISPIPEFDMIVKNDVLKVHTTVDPFTGSSVTYREPIALEFIDSYLKKGGYKTKLFTETSMNSNQLMDSISRFNPHIAGISVHSAVVYPDTVAIARQLKERNPKTKIIIGGYHPTGEIIEFSRGNVKERYDNDFFFVNRFPFAVKPFYVMRVDEDNKYARSVDMIFKGLEISSGGQREHRYEELIKNIKEKKMDLKNLKWFTDFFRYGAPPMGGFCIGIERLTMKLLDLSNVKESVLFTRSPERILP